MKIKIKSLGSIECSKLIGGFSQALSDSTNSSNKVNNCNGGNFKVGCVKKNKPVKKDTLATNNCKTNCIKGCGPK